MIALITGASSGIGRDIARYLNKKGYDLIITARDRKKLKELQKELENNNNLNVELITADLSKEEECIRLYKTIREKYSNIDILINNAGFGLYGRFVETDLTTELSMIRTNVEAVHILTKLFLQDMVKEDKGHILNVSSVAGFMPGPLMTTYYSTKNYVFRFTESIKTELSKQKSNVKISVLCPGPVNTNFNNVAKVKFNLPSVSSEYIAKYAINKMLKGKFKIIPRLEIKLVRVFSKLLPDSILAQMSYYTQKRKSKDI